MSSASLAALKQDAYEEIDKRPEESLLVLVKVLKTVNETNQNAPSKRKVRKPGIAEGKLKYPDDIDEDNELIASWFEGNE